MDVFQWSVLIFISFFFTRWDFFHLLWMPLLRKVLHIVYYFHNPSYTELTLHFSLPPFKNTLLIYFFLFSVVISANIPHVDGTRLDFLSLRERLSIMPNDCKSWKFIGGGEAGRLAWICLYTQVMLIYCFMTSMTQEHSYMLSCISFSRHA